MLLPQVIMDAANYRLMPDAAKTFEDILGGVRVEDQDKEHLADIKRFLEGLADGPYEDVFTPEVEQAVLSFKRLICDRCGGSGTIEFTIGGDGYGGRCCGEADVEGPCPECSE